MTDYEKIHDLQFKNEHSETIHEIGTFEYMPINFHGIDTKNFGMMSKRYDEDGNKLEHVEVHPFFKLKEIALDTNIDFVERMQAVRYMCYIPYIDAINHCLDSVRSIVFDDALDIYKRYHFFSNNEKYFKLTDEIVHKIHYEFFEYGLENNYPFELLVLSSRYIFCFYSSDEDIRQKSLDWLLDIADDDNETHKCRSETADILITCGEPDEIKFGKQIIDKIGKKDDFYQSSENIHSEYLSESACNIIRSLRSERLSAKVDANSDVSPITSETIYSSIENYTKTDEEKEMLRKIFFRIQTDPTRFERLTILDILILVYHKMQLLIKANVTSSSDIYYRLYQELSESNDTCSTGYFIRILNVLQGYVKEKEFQLRIDPKDELHSVVFARLNLALRRLGTTERDSVLESISSDTDKSVAEEFILFNSPEEELLDQYSSLLDEEIYYKIIKECQDKYINK